MKARGREEMKGKKKRERKGREERIRKEVVRFGYCYEYKVKESLERV